MCWVLSKSAFEYSSFLNFQGTVFPKGRDRKQTDSITYSPLNGGYFILLCKHCIPILILSNYPEYSIHRFTDLFNDVNTEYLQDFMLLITVASFLLRTCNISEENNATHNFHFYSWACTCFQHILIALNVLPSD